MNHTSHFALSIHLWYNLLTLSARLYDAEPKNWGSVKGGFGPALKKRFICPAPCLQGCTKSYPVPVSFGSVHGQRGGQVDRQQVGLEDGRRGAQVGSAWRRWTCEQKSWWTRRQAGRQTTKRVIFHLSDVRFENEKMKELVGKNSD